MANTEGLPDEFVASLMTTPVSATTTASKAKESVQKDSSASGGGVPDIVEQSQPQKPRVNRRRRKHMPIGTFVTKPKPPRRSPAKVTKSTTSTPPSQPIEPRSEPESMRQASARDATNMLAQMSTDEIQSHQRDLEAALSPEMKAFLKARSKKKKEAEPVVKEGVVPEPTKTVRMETKKPEKDSQEEKERLAKLMSSVRTHRAYHQEMQQAHPLEHETPVGKAEEGNSTAASQDMPSNDSWDKDFDMACDLLRSSAKRQTLWAAPLVSHSLSKRVQELKQEKLLGRAPPSTTSKRKNWPLLLPISLRTVLNQCTIG